MIDPADQPNLGEKSWELAVAGDDASGKAVPRGQGKGGRGDSRFLGQ